MPPSAYPLRGGVRRTHTPTKLYSCTRTLNYTIIKDEIHCRLLIKPLLQSSSIDNLRVFLHHLYPSMAGILFTYPSHFLLNCTSLVIDIFQCTRYKLRLFLSQGIPPTFLPTALQAWSKWQF